MIKIYDRMVRYLRRSSLSATGGALNNAVENWEEGNKILFVVEKYILQNETGQNVPEMKKG